MKISKIEFENFRNFKEHGEIKCSTDGRVTIVYGKNGDGKTTLHQLFQWIFYGQVHFNKTTTDRLYNLEYESEQSFGAVFQVMGRIDFEHDGFQYSLTRTQTYKKGLDDSEKLNEEVALLMMDSDNNWKPIDKPKEIIEKLLPSGLSDYFFFDGESMIADLRVKGKDSASKLRKALYSMFDLDIIEAAIAHIGKTELKTTVLGKLYLDKGSAIAGGEIAKVKTDIENAQNKIAKLESSIEDAKAKKKSYQETVTQISEQIGQNKSKTDYERQRKALKKQRDVFLDSAAMAQQGFGDAILDMFPKLFISKAVADAKEKIHLQVEKSKLPTGVNKKLITFLLSPKTTECICGNPLHDAERAKLQAYSEMLPPKSFTSLYHDFSRTAQQWGQGYDLAKIEAYISNAYNNQQQAESCDTQIHALDEAEKKSPDIEDLIVARQQAEDGIIAIDEKLSALNTQLEKFRIYLKKQMKAFDDLTTKTATNEVLNRKIAIMQAVSEQFTARLQAASTEYSHLLEENIQYLIDNMLTSRRYVSVSPEFSVKVTDGHNDESKSEGQFAVVSFAYIGGILKMLQSEEQLASKEYPLVLDGPFSKLDSDQRQNVVNMIPKFAPQVILFTKDDLQNVFDKEHIGRVWTISSNDEKNVATVKEGFLWK